MALQGSWAQSAFANQSPRAIDRPFAYCDAGTRRPRWSTRAVHPDCVAPHGRWCQHARGSTRTENYLSREESVSSGAAFEPSKECGPSREGARLTGSRPLATPNGRRWVERESLSVLLARRASIRRRDARLPTAAAQRWRSREVLAPREKLTFLSAEPSTIWPLRPRPRATI